MNRPITRRRFIKRTSITTAWMASLGTLRSGARTLSPNEKLNIGIIGVANQGLYNLSNVSSENIVALCDVDDDHLSAVAQRFPDARKYNDFRRLLEQNDIDAVVVATPDHTHAVAAVAALRSGRHVYCEKPLARTISEVRAVTNAARDQKRVTQIGTQIHAGSNYRRVVELVQSGAIGSVRDVHVWVSATYGGMERPSASPVVPSNLHYELWLGPVPARPYSPEYLPFKWRNWWAFGGGALADFGCHFLDLPHWALGLSRPSTVEVVDGPPVHPESTPPWLIVRYDYPARTRTSEKGTPPVLPPVTLTWYHGGKRPTHLSSDLAAKWKSGVLFVGDKGSLLSDYGRHALLPEKDFDGFAAPAPFIAESIGHHREWIQACKTGSSTTCGFDYSGPLSESTLLGNVAYRASRKLNWDAENLKAIGCPEADEFIRHLYRDGWSL